jgi:hypothetical protein
MRSPTPEHSSTWQSVRTLVRVARVEGSERAEDEARRLDEALMAALAAVRAVARPR